MGQKRLGIKQVSLDGVVLDAKGEWSYSLGGEKRETVAGQDRIHGVKITRIPAFMEGMVTDGKDIDLKKLTASNDSNVTLDLQNGKTIKLGHAYYCLLYT